MNKKSLAILLRARMRPNNSTKLALSPLPNEVNLMQSSGSRAAQHALENENKPQNLVILIECFRSFLVSGEEAQLAGAEEVGGYPAAFYRIGRNLRHALKPMYESLFERLNMHPGGLKFLSSLRADILYILCVRASPDYDPASLLEKIVAYEACFYSLSCNLIDLKRRLGDGRRCFGYLHPAIPGEPLIFIEVVLLKNVAQTIQCALILSRAIPELIVTEVIVYAVHMSNISFSVVICPKGRPGLGGINLGKFLIKRVITLGKRGMPQISTYATLSLVPGYIQWLISKLASQSKLAEVEDISQSSDGGSNSTFL
ncbi:hypothetical protein Patl1_09927 [Pistacia atlantica]|uniref:Uncharacterized protein n=1 Tax=Pistacia atlantica TaxID=434234 RepID=A0ACC1A984_9ROSI|nr:hypothetical protein Patl1_09927 [Pistacia atlantica]